MECSVCNIIKQPTKEIKVPCFPCDSCKNNICFECSDLSTTELRCIYLQKRNLKYYCKRCNKFELLNILENTIKDKNKIIEDQELIVKLLKEKIEHLEKSNQKSYANVLQQSKETSSTNVLKPNIPAIIVKPKKPQSFDKTKMDLNKINPGEIKVGITNTKINKSGNMIIKCQKKNEVEILKQTLANKLKENYNIELSQLKQPKIKIVKVTQDFTPEEIKNYLKNQNNIIGDITVNYIRQNRDKTKTIICECEPKAFHQILDMKKVCLGWERFMVYEDLDVPKCFKCQEYFHKNDKCVNRIVCPICSGEHLEKDCPKEHKHCRNCEVNKDKYNTSYATDHESRSPDCPTLKFHLQMLRSKINYVNE